MQISPALQDVQRFYLHLLDILHPPHRSLGHGHRSKTHPNLIYHDPSGQLFELLRALVNNTPPSRSQRSTLAVLEDQIILRHNERALSDCLSSCKRTEISPDLQTYDGIPACDVIRLAALHLQLHFPLGRLLQQGVLPEAHRGRTHARSQSAKDTTEQYDP